MSKKRQTVTGHLMNSKGFTIIEITAILIILLILTAVAVSRNMSARNDVVAEADIVKSHLRYAQMKALQDDVNTWVITFTSNSYTLSCTGTNCPASSSILLPSESGSSHTFSAGVTAGGAIVTYDSWGSPTGGAVDVILTQGSQTSTINVAADTGYITP